MALASLGFAFLLPAAEAPKSEPVALPYTNAVPVSVFKVMDPFTTRDPFCPIGYQKKPPVPVNIGNGGRPPPPAELEIKLKVTGISMMAGGESLATLSSGEMLAVGETHKYRDPANKETVVEYKVVQITEESVVVSYNGKQFTSLLTEADLDRFKEKEEPNENPKP